MSEVTEMELATLMRGMTEQQRMLFISQYNSVKKDRNIALILSVLLGVWGVDRFYVGDTLLGILKLFTAGCCGIWYLVDWFLIMGRVDEYNRNKAREIAASICSYMDIGSHQPSPSTPENQSLTSYQQSSERREAIPPASQIEQPKPQAPPIAPMPSQPQAIPANLVVWLEVVQGPNVGQRFFVLKSDNLVGRSSKSDIQILEPSISRRHFRLRFEGGQFLLENESAHGTYVNGQPVMGWQPLKDGDYIQAGRVVFQFRMQGRA